MQRSFTSSVRCVAVAVLAPWAHAQTPCGFEYIPLPAPPGMERRYEAAMTSNGGVVVMIGGFGFLSGGGIGTMSDTWEYRGGGTSEPGWVEQGVTGSPPSPRNGAGVCFDGSNGVVLYGGENLSYTESESTYTFDYLANTFIRRGTGPYPRHLAGLARNPGSSGVVLFGGRATYNAVGVSTQYGDTWTTDSFTSWNLRGSSPPARFQHTMTYVPSRNRVVMFGGRTTAGQPFGDTWEWDGNTWSQRFPPNAPPARSAHAATYDPRSQRVIMYGGWNLPQGGGAHFAELWSYDGSTWSQLPQLAGPALPARRSAGLGAFFDSNHTNPNIIMFTGFQPGLDAMSDGGLIRLLLPPTSISISSPRCVEAGQTSPVWTLQVNANGPLAPYSVLWRKNGVPIDTGLNPTAATAQLAFPGGVQDADAGLYDVVVSPICGPAVTSNSAVLGVRPATWITALPQDATICPGGSATFTIQTNVAVDLDYQWWIELDPDDDSGLRDTISDGPYAYDGATLTFTGSTTSQLTVSTNGIPVDFSRAIIGCDLFKRCDSGGSSGLVTANATLWWDIVRSAPAPIGGGGAICDIRNVGMTAQPTGATGPLTFEWQARAGTTSPWTTLTPFLEPLACGPESAGRANPSDSPGSQITVRVCNSLETRYQVRYRVLTGCGYALESDPVEFVKCVADFNCAGGATVQDIFDFLAGYFASDPRANVNGAAGITVQDIFDFLAAYFQGC